MTVEQIHLVPGDPSVTQAMLDAKAIEWGNEIDDVWNTGNPFQLEDENGLLYDINFNVVFVDQAFIDANGDALVTTVTVHPTVAGIGGVNTLNWALDQAQYTASHEYGHVSLGLLDAWAGASPSPQPPPPPDGLDDEALMGALVPVLRLWYFDNVLDYLDGLGIDMILAGAPPVGIPGGDTPDEAANQVTGNSGFTYIPEPTSFALLALGVGVLMRRGKRGA